VTSDKKEFAVVDIKDFQIKFSQQRLLEEQRIPSDTAIIDKTWAKVNKNGTPDKRFVNNYEIPVVKYGELEIKTYTGLNESYAFSCFEKSEDFAKKFIELSGLSCISINQILSLPKINHQIDTLICIPLV
jgi:hypothetical protein